MIKIIYKDVAVGSREAFEPTATSADAISHINEIPFGNQTFPRFATTGELNSMLLDGSASAFPDDESNDYIGLWSNTLSDKNGDFVSPLVLTMSADGYYSSQGITLYFGDNHASAVNIKWYRGDELLSDVDFLPDASEYFCENKIDSYDKIVVTFISSVFPCQRIKLQGIMHGRVRIFSGRELTDTAVIQECSPISAELAINTLDFTLIGDEDINYLFQRKQSLELYNNTDLLGVFFVSEYNRISERFYDVSAEDYIGLLDAVEFTGGIYVDRNAYELLTVIFDGANIPFTIDEALKSKTVTGWLPICSCREAVRQICFAVGAAVDTTRSETVRIFLPSETVIHSYGLGEIMQGLKNTDRDKKLTELRLTVYGYAQSSETMSVFNAKDDGVGDGICVRFSEPLHSLTITNGEIVEFGANYAVINASDGCTVTGSKYTRTSRIRSKRNPIVNVGDPQNVVTISDMTLISASNADERLEALYNYYAVQGNITGELVISGQRPGDKIEIATTNDSTTTARIESMRYNLYGGAIVAEVNAR